MLSILIPTYNYNIFPLVSELNSQCLNAKINFEIIVLDDFSTYFLEENKKIYQLENCQFHSNKKNLGRTQTRNSLAGLAKYKWILFLDADVIPVHKNFITTYISSINNETQVIIGGYQYENILPHESKILRYKYGKSREEKLASVRNKKPYSSVFSGNLLIQKNVFQLCNYAGNHNFYGMDIYFSYQLFIRKINVLHIDNGIFHLGLEKNDVFFEKSLQSVLSRTEILANKDKIEIVNNLLSKYKLLKKYHLTGVVNCFFKLSKSFLKRKILNKNPSLFCFDLYRLGFICSLKK
ncbi:MAG TPA: glycosyltransferase family A protein [Flavobacterium sp.]|jgi:glycosyltransferase involved in cell wall biosynthesis